MIDLTADYYEPWQPHIGQQVRVRLSGECRVPAGLYVYAQTGRIVRAGDTDAAHQPQEDGRSGRVVRLIESRSGHYYVVDYDESFRSRTGARAIGGSFAAIELEPVENARPAGFVSGEN